MKVVRSIRNIYITYFCNILMSTEYTPGVTRKAVEYEFRELDRVGKRKFRGVLLDTSVSYDLSVLRKPEGAKPERAQ